MLVLDFSISRGWPRPRPRLFGDEQTIFNQQRSKSEDEDEDEGRLIRKPRRELHDKNHLTTYTHKICYPISMEPLFDHEKLDVYSACLDASVAKRFVSGDRIRPGKEMLARVVAMLTRLADRFDTDDNSFASLDSLLNRLPSFSSSSSSSSSADIFRAGQLLVLDFSRGWPRPRPRLFGDEQTIFNQQRSKSEDEDDDEDEGRLIRKLRRELHSRGLSYYSDKTAARSLCISEALVAHARLGLLQAGLIAYEAPPLPGTESGANIEQ
jgi:hypothetical protein